MQTVEFGKNSALVPCPLKPEVSLHWLAVNGGQPLTADNPSVITADADDQPLLLPKELQVPAMFFLSSFYLPKPTAPFV
jgi:hypothetical protein